MSQRGYKQGLRKKLVVATLLVGILPVILGLVLTYLKGTEELRKAIGANFAGLSRETAHKTDLVIGHSIDSLVQLARSPAVLEAVSRANQAYEGQSEQAVIRADETASREWENARQNESGRHPVLSNPASVILMNTLNNLEDQAIRPALYVTDERGSLVGSVNHFPRFLSNDSNGWIRTYAGGKGQTFIGNLYPDEKTNRFLFDIGVPVLDPSSGRGIGVVMSVNNVKEFFKVSIHEIRFGRTGHAMLIDGNGDVLVCPILPTGMHVPDLELVRQIAVHESTWSLVANDAHGGKDSIIGTSPVEKVNQILARSGSASWYSFIRQDPKELYAPIRSLMTYASTASVTLLGLLFLLALAVSKRFVRPVHILHEGAELIGRGNLSHRLKIETNDEIEQLANEFNQMAINLQDSYTSLEHRVADRTRELATLNTIAITVNQSLDLQQILDDTLAKVLEVMHLQAGVIRLWDPERGRLFLKAHRGVPTQLTQVTAELSTEDYISGKVVKLGKPMVIEESQLADYPDSPLVQGGFRSILCIPIKSEDRLLGTLTIAETAPHHFTPSDLQLMSSIGSQMGTAIVKATLYERERKMVEQLKEIDRFKSDFLSNVSHELRMPLTSIIGFSELILDRIPGELTPDQEEYVKNMQESGQHLLEIINNLLNLSKLRAGKMAIQPREFELASSIENLKQTMNPLVASKGLSLEAVIEPGIPRLFTDEGKVKQILLNLLSNAIKFTPAGGEIRIRSRLATLNDQAAVEIAVLDTGIGIRPEDKIKIFEEFQQVDASYTRDYAGTGLGLTISNQFIGMLGGKIRVESQYGHGSTFTISIPLQIAPAGTAPAPTPEVSAPALDVTEAAVPEITTSEPESAIMAAPSSLPRILVVEDDPTVGRLMTLYLTQEGYHVDHALDGEEAIQKARILKPFAITLDIMLPRYDGWEVLQKLKQYPETRGIPVIIVSIIENRELGFSLGAVDYFTKPIDRKALLESLKRLSLSAKIQRKPINVLIIDDDPKMLKLISAILETEGFGALKASQAIEGIDLAIEVQPDLILLDLLLPDISGFEALDRLKLHPTAKNIPVIIFTGRELTDQDLDRLNTRIRGVIHKGKSVREALINEIRKFEKLYPDKARMVDGLTGFYNERYLQNRLADEVNRAIRIQRTFSLLLTNLDGFRSINEQFGVQAGNRILREAAERFKQNTRSANPLCRCGGSTFAILLTETTRDFAFMVGEKMRSTIADKPFPLETKDQTSKRTHPLTISVGIATCFEDGETPEQIMTKAMQALDEARAAGGNCIVKKARSSGPEKSPGVST